MLNNRNIVLNLLKKKKKTYFEKYYQNQKTRFVYCYTNKYFNLNARFTQLIEKTYSKTKKHVNKHILINKSTKRVFERVKTMKYNNNNIFTKQRSNLFVFINHKVFKNINIKITHFAIEKFIVE